MTSIQQALRDLQQFRDDFLNGAYPQRTALGPGTLQKNFFKSKSIVSGMIDVSNLQSLSTKTGSLTVDGGITVGTGGSIASGLTDFSTDASNKGYWLGIVGGTPKLLIGGRITATTPRIEWDGTALNVLGTIKAESGYLKALSVYGTLTLGTSTTDGAIAAGKTSYSDDATNGFFLDYNSGGSPRVNIGNNVSYIKWTGTTLAVKGAIYADSGTFAGSLSAATGTFAGSLSAATGTFAGALSAASGTFAGSLSAATGTLGALTINGTLTLGSGGISGTYLSVASNGSLTASNASLTGNIYASGGTIGGLTINSGDITVASGKYIKWGSNYISDSLIHFEVGVGTTTAIEWKNTSYGTHYANIRGYGSSSAMQLESYVYYDGSHYAQIYSNAASNTAQSWLSAQSGSYSAYAYAYASDTQASCSFTVSVGGYTPIVAKYDRITTNVLIDFQSTPAGGSKTLQGYTPVMIQGVTQYFAYYA